MSEVNRRSLRISSKQNITYVEDFNLVQSKSKLRLDKYRAIIFLSNFFFQIVIDGIIIEKELEIGHKFETNIIRSVYAVPLLPYFYVTVSLKMRSHFYSSMYSFNGLI